MQIVWDKLAIEQMRGKHTLLELETFDFKGEPVTTYCVIPPEKIINDLAILDSLKDLHNKFLEAFKNQDLGACEMLSQQLTGRFGGELDTFYEEIIKRLK